MRIIAGNLRGLKLSSPDGEETRPTLDRVKEAVFSILMPYVYDSVVLDMFAGSGALGIEALSRGAKKAVFAEKRRDAANCIKNNIDSAKLAEKSEVFFGDVFNYLNKCNICFDIVFIDPPYNSDLYYRATDFISDYLSEDGLVVMEWDCTLGKPDFSDKLQVVKEKKYGRIGITILKRG